MRQYRATLALAAALAIACNELTPSAPQPRGSITGTDSATVQMATPPTPISCPLGAADSANADANPLGGYVALGGHDVSLPAGAVDSTVNLVLTQPASNTMEVDIHPRGAAHMTFAEPITVTIDYSRCDTDALVDTPLSVWYLDDVTKEPIENMGGIDDKVQRRVTFQTGHLSSYVVAY